MRHNAFRRHGPAKAEERDLQNSRAEIRMSFRPTYCTIHLARDCRLGLAVLHWKPQPSAYLKWSPMLHNAGSRSPRALADTPATAFQEAQSRSKRVKASQTLGNKRNPVLVKYYPMRYPILSQRLMDLFAKAAMPNWGGDDRKATYGMR